MAYVKDLGRILELGTSEERREFLKTFVKRVFWNDPEVTMEYTLPLPPAKLNLWPEDVVHFDNAGGPSWIRTRDLSLIRTKSFVLFYAARYHFRTMHTPLRTKFVPVVPYRSIQCQPVR